MHAYATGVYLTDSATIAIALQLCGGICITYKGHTPMRPEHKHEQKEVEVVMCLLAVAYL